MINSLFYHFALRLPDQKSKSTPGLTLFIIKTIRVFNKIYILIIIFGIMVKTYLTILIKMSAH